MTVQDETVLYTGPGTTITDAHAIIDGRTYALSDVHSASLDKSAGWGPYAWAALLAGLAIAIGGYLAWGTLLPPVIAGATLAIVGLVLLFTTPRRYFVRIRDHDGSVVSVPVTSEERAHRIIEAVDKARLRERQAGGGDR
ncbi:MAG: hypothetical protein RLZZ387_324 [Chloroflexota bacterium]|jgi:hypothetical protein